MEKNTPEEIKQAVLGRYSAHARRRLANLEETATPCCGPAQPQVSETSSCACSATPSAEADLNLAGSLYSVEELEELPEDVLTSLGCGNPTAIAGLREGEAVLDLGSGGGLDCFLAAKKVGPSGRVVGLDMSADMIQLARRNARRVGAENVQFRLGEMEEMPFPDGSFDVIISNCVINLSPDKDAVLRECYRVLKPGGRLRVSDIVWTREPEEKERSDLASWTACVAGALTEADYASKLRAAGFREVRVEQKGDPGTPVVNLFSAYISAEK
jgi:SAM-dependent methyltransferase